MVIGAKRSSFHWIKMPRKKIDNLYNKPLCFTTSRSRPYMLYNCISNILKQTYTDFTYYVNINIKNEKDKELYTELLKDFSDDQRLNYLFSTAKTQHENYLRPLLEANTEKYNLFIKIDDDDIYKKQYIETVINLYKKNKKDILSCSLDYCINGINIQKGEFDSIGIWPGDDHSIKFGMPCTYVMNQSAVNILLRLTPDYIKSIHRFEDPAWRTEWRKAGLKTCVIKNFKHAIYHIHGKNISSSYLLDNSCQNKEYIENEFFIFCKVKHKWWESYCYFNKRNNRIYNINNDDHGAYSANGNEISILWDKWGEEFFIKKTEDSQYYELK